jgi:alkanesulfonate monooxygenase SsuD/methylene tetrahydromethanopterin reductase-like flavin-dependent oxidoreductase (luciferase family)
MGAATKRMRVGTWIANIYVRHSYVCAQGAALIADATAGRFSRGLGVSHQPVNQALGIDMANPAEAVRQYVIEVRGWLRGEGPTTHLPQHPAPEHVPIYVAALTSRTVEQAAALADGIIRCSGLPSASSRARSGRAAGGPPRRNSGRST